MTTDISDILATDARDSRGKPTLAVTVRIGTSAGTFSVPSGASTGAAEAKELRDADGGVATAIRNVNEIIRPALIGHDAANQEEIDRTMLALDGTPNKEKLGGNALIGVSIACAKAAAAARAMPVFEHLRSLAQIAPSHRVPYLYMNYINGGKHASSPLSFQEHMLVPDTEDVHEALSFAERIDASLDTLLALRYGETTVVSLGDEGGHVIPEQNWRVPFELLTEAIAKAGLEGSVRLASDIAASSFYADGVYSVGGESYDARGMHTLYDELLSRFPLLSLEDPFDEIAFDDFTSLQSRTAARVVGDDLTVTDPARIEHAAHSGCIRAVIIKPNQIGTLSETLSAMKTARENSIDCIVSHRSGETMDDFVADLAFAFGAFGLKAGALRKPERRAKYDRLATIART